MPERDEGLIGKLSRTVQTAVSKLTGEKGPVVTVVSGLPRSGTSMMMRMLEAGGLPPLTDHERTADEDNPEGYYEFERVKKLDEGDTAWLPQAQGKAVKVISALLKHLPEGYTYRVVFMRRKLEEVLASQRKMLERRGEDPDQATDEELKELFMKHVHQIETWADEQDNVQVLFVSYNDLLSDPVRRLTQVDAFLGGHLDVEAMAEVVDPDLYRNRA